MNDSGKSSSLPFGLLLADSAGKEPKSTSCSWRKLWAAQDRCKSLIIWIRGNRSPHWQLLPP